MTSTPLVFLSDALPAIRAVIIHSFCKYWYFWLPSSKTRILYRVSMIVGVIVAEYLCWF